MLTEDAVIETVNRLNRSVSELRKAHDLDGLLRIQAEALAISTKANGRTRRKAKRIANKASDAVSDILDHGGQTRLERADRDAREVREQAAAQRPDTSSLFLLGRVVTLLHLLLFEGSPVSDELGLLQDLAHSDDKGFLLIEIPDDVHANAGALVRGYEQSRQLFRTAAYRRSKTDAESILKTLAVELINEGAEVRNLGGDSIPLVAYGLFMRRINSDLKHPDTVTAKLDAIVLDVSNEVSRVPPAARQLYLSVFRLVLLLGEAQAYAERHGVAAFLPSTHGRDAH
jgi:hypothetical protein